MSSYVIYFVVVTSPAALLTNDKKDDKNNDQNKPYYDLSSCKYEHCHYQQNDIILSICIYRCYKLLMEQHIISSQAAVIACPESIRRT